MHIIHGGVIPEAAQKLEDVLRDARRLDSELVEFFGRAADVKRDMTQLGCTIEYSFPPLVGHAHELYTGLAERSSHALKVQGA